MEFAKNAEFWQNASRVFDRLWTERGDHNGIALEFSRTHGKQSMKLIQGVPI